MYKKELGFSIYPEHFSYNENVNYINYCCEYKYSKVFMSLIHFGSGLNREIITLYEDIIKYCKSKDLYVILDINDDLLETLKIKDLDFSYFENIGVSCLRLDAPLLPSKIAELTYVHKLDYQVNMSNNDSFINNIIDFQPVKSKIFGCHNFYPLKYSALPLEFFVNSTTRFVKLGLHTSSFVGSQIGNRGPQSEKVGPLVTVEEVRYFPIRSQAKFLFATGLISTVIIGNQSASKEEIKNLSELLENDKIELDIELCKKLSNEEKNIIHFYNHFRRGDISEYVIRSTQPRAYFKNLNIKAENNDKIFKRGDVVIINNKNKHYQGELVIILQDDFSGFGEEANLIGKVKDYDLPLLKYIKGWNKFNLREV